MTLDLIEAPPAMAELPETQRERLLGISLSGTHYCVLEVHYHRVGPGDSEEDWHVAAYQCSGWYRGSARAGQRRAELASQGLWLSQRTRDRMSRGENVPVGQLEWER
jgi:hypothetical protein